MVCEVSLTEGVAFVPTHLFYAQRGRIHFRVMNARACVVALPGPDP